MCICIYMCVRQFTAAVLTKTKSHKILHETKIDFSRNLSNLEKFWFSKKMRFWGFHSPRSDLELKQLTWANYSVRFHKGLFCRVKFCTAMTKAVRSVPKDPSAPTALGLLPAHTAIHTMPGNSLGITESCGTETIWAIPDNSSWSRRGNPRWDSVSDPAFCRTTSESLSVPAYLSALQINAVIFLSSCFTVPAV